MNTDTGLNLTQQEWIRASIEHFLEFPSNSPAFLAFIKKLFDDLTNNTPTEGPSLCNILFKPQQYLYRLEKQNNKAISTKAVKAYLLHVIDTAIKQASSDRHIILSETHWNISLLEKQHVEIMDDTLFVSIKNNYEAASNEWSLPEPQGKIYSAHLIFLAQENPTDNLATTYEAIVEVEITIGKQIKKNQTISLGLLSPQQPHSEREYIDQLHEKAILKIEAEAALQALNYINSYYYIVSSKLKSLLLQHPHANRVLSNRYWLNFFSIKKHHVLLSSLLDISTESARNLDHHAIITLHQKHYLLFAQAKELSSHQFTLLIHPFYQKVIIQHKISVNALLSLDKKQTKALLSGNIIHLIINKKISWSLLLQLPGQSIQLLGSIHYQGFKLYKEPFVGLLKNLPEYINKIAFHPKFIQLMIHQIIQPSHLIFLRQEVVKLLTGKFADFIFCCLSNKMLYFIEVEKAALTNHYLLELATICFARRMFMLFKSTPYSVDEKIDNTNYIKTDMLIITEESDLDMHSIKEASFYLFFHYLKLECENYMIADTHFFKTLSAHITTACQVKKPCQFILTEILDYADTTLKQAAINRYIEKRCNRSSLNLFITRPETSVEQFCQALKKLTALQTMDSSLHLKPASP
jgi:hypothetical protein